MAMFNLLDEELEEIERITSVAYLLGSFIECIVNCTNTVYTSVNNLLYPKENRKHE